METQDTLAARFLDWADDNGRRFKWECHSEIVRDYCAGATIRTVIRVSEFAFENPEIYDEITVVNFPDNSEIKFNYKGEDE